MTGQNRPLGLMPLRKRVINMGILLRIFNIKKNLLKRRVVFTIVTFNLSSFIVK